MEKDPDVWALTGDLGYGGFDKIRKDFPERFVNCGASEQAMLDIAVGLALKGKKPFVYTITPFFWRAAETIRLYMDHEKIPVRLVGSGRDKDYAHDGFSHDATDVNDLVDIFSNIEQLCPKDKDSIPAMVEMMTEQNRPWFLSLKR
jgi:transketolase